MCSFTEVISFKNKKHCIHLFRLNVYQTLGYKFSQEKNLLWLSPLSLFPHLASSSASLIWVSTCKSYNTIYFLKVWHLKKWGHWRKKKGMFLWKSRKVLKSYYTEPVSNYQSWFKHYLMLLTPINPTSLAVWDWKTAPLPSITCLLGSKFTGEEAPCTHILQPWSIPPLKIVLFWETLWDTHLLRKLFLNTSSVVSYLVLFLIVKDYQNLQ